MTMNSMFDKYVNEFELQLPTTIDKLKEVESSLQLNFPQDYVSFMLESNGAEGSIGESGYLQLWTVENLLKHNEGYQVKEFAPGIFLFGTDGGNVAYGFFEKDGETNLIEIPLMGMDLDEMNILGKTFVEFLEYLYHE